MTASATTSSPAYTQAQTNKDLTQSHLQHFNQSALFHIQQNALFQQQQQQQQIQSSSPTMSSTSVSSPTPSAQHYFQSSPQQQHMYSMDQQEQHHHHMQILGNHPASPGSGMFLDLPADPFMPVRGGNFLFTDCSSSMMAGTEPHLLQYAATSSAPVAEDCQASHEYMYAQQPMIKSEFSNEHFAAMAPTYMMSMARSFSDSQLSQICGSAVSGVASVAVKAEMCDSPLYAQQSLYEDDSYNVNSNNNLYSNQHHNHHHHHHSYSTSSLSTFSDSSMSPRSTFSSSNNSLASYPLSRTLSEPPFHQGMISTSSSMSDLAKLGNESDAAIAAVKPTPKRSRGRRVSNHPDNSGCKVFTCRVEDCGKVFKRSEHLKRHVRSIHTLEKPFPCPIHNCPKRFSRSDNLNQHIRIHRHNSGRCVSTEKNSSSKEFSSFTPFLQTYPTDLISL
ncbi:hypothetical protein BGX26_003140 [Mortierella sp. AD094]|nr:hypothetical protein BGX26_003140 [Mortierella sp. AD094]